MHDHVFVLNRAWAGDHGEGAPDSRVGNGDNRRLRVHFTRHEPVRHRHANHVHHPGHHTQRVLAVRAAVPGDSDGRTRRARDDVWTVAEPASLFCDGFDLFLRGVDRHYHKH